MKVKKLTIVTDPEYLPVLSKFNQCQIIDTNNLFSNIKSLYDKDACFLILIKERDLKDNLDLIVPWLDRHLDTMVNLLIISDNYKDRLTFDSRIQDFITYILPGGLQEGFLLNVIEQAVHSMHLVMEGLNLDRELINVYHDLRSVTKVGQALLTERDFDALISLILGQAKEIVDADSGSIYVVEPSEVKGQKPTKLRFKKSSLNLSADEFLLDINANSIAGYVAMTGHHLKIDDVYLLNGKEGYKFNPEYDKTFNYHTKSMMLIPMKNHRNEVIGVIQLINKKLDKARNLTPEEMKGKWVIGFTEKCYEVVSALAGQAAMAIENNALLGEIKNLFDGFVKASVKAIEQRDPTTSGHSARVADYTEGVAVCLDAATKGKFSQLSFSKDQLRELRYAALLHDFGKVGVREKVLVKAKKLYPLEMDLIEWRFHLIRRTIEKEHIQNKFDILKKSGPKALEKVEEVLDKEHRENIEKLNEMFESVAKANEPSILEEGDFKTLETLTNKMIMLDNGHRVPFLEKSEFLSLSVKKGTLDAHERLEIESHVSHTYQFLSQIPWTSDLYNVPDIAHGHHEKLDGSGYPLGIDAPKISVQTRIMTISDIFDALTAWDRPYKKALPMEKALDILVDEARQGKVDRDILDVFIESETYKKFHSSLIF